MWAKLCGFHINLVGTMWILTSQKKVCSKVCVSMRITNISHTRMTFFCIKISIIHHVTTYTQTNEKWYFEYSFDDNFCYNFLSYIHIIFYFISLLLEFSCKYLFFLCKLWLSQKLSTKLVVQITFLQINTWFFVFYKNQI